MKDPEETKLVRIRGIDPTADHTGHWEGSLHGGGIIRIISTGNRIVVEENQTNETATEDQGWIPFLELSDPPPPADPASGVHTLIEVLEITGFELDPCRVPDKVRFVLSQLNYYLEIDPETTSAISRCAVSAPANGELERDPSILVMANVSKIGGSRCLSVLGLLNGVLGVGENGPWIARQHDDGNPEGVISRFTAIDRHGRVTPWRESYSKDKYRDREIIKIDAGVLPPPDWSKGIPAFAPDEDYRPARISLDFYCDPDLVLAKGSVGRILAWLGVICAAVLIVSVLSLLKLKI